MKELLGSARLGKNKKIQIQHIRPKIHIKCDNLVEMVVQLSSLIPHIVYCVGASGFGQYTSFASHFCESKCYILHQKYVFLSTTFHNTHKTLLFFASTFCIFFIIFGILVLFFFFFVSQFSRQHSTQNIFVLSLWLSSYYSIYLMPWIVQLNNYKSAALCTAYFDEFWKNHQQTRNWQWGKRRPTILNAWCHQLAIAILSNLCNALTILTVIWIIYNKQQKLYILILKLVMVLSVYKI